MPPSLCSTLATRHLPLKRGLLPTQGLGFFGFHQGGLLGAAPAAFELLADCVMLVGGMGCINCFLFLKYLIQYRPVPGIPTDI